MTIATLVHDIVPHGTFARILQRCSDALRRRRRLRRLDELPECLLRELGRLHLTREERHRLGGHRWL